MTKSENLIKELMNHPIIRTELPMQMILGLPYLEKKAGRLCMTFMPHREEYRDGFVEYYPRQFEVTFLYPFRRLASFRNLTLEKEISAQEPVCRVEASFLTGQGVRLITELYEACDRLLSFQKQDGKVSDTSISKYQQTFWSTVEKLGLAPLYRGTEA